MIVGFGCFFGGMLRYFLENLWVKDKLNFPLGTFSADFLGCLIMGMAIGYFSMKSQASSKVKTFLTTGFCGGLTTFSSFALEVMKYLRQDALTLAAYYTILNLFFGIIAIFCGLRLTAMILKPKNVKE